MPIGTSAQAMGVSAMHWSAYEVFSVISGVLLIAGAMLPGAPARLGLFLVGAVLIGYGIVVANQSSGFWIFPIWIFIVPPGALLYATYVIAVTLHAAKDVPRRYDDVTPVGRIRAESVVRSSQTTDRGRPGPRGDEREDW